MAQVDEWTRTWVPWFLNGDTKICYAKVPGATNDTVTKPSTNFSAVRSIRFMYHVQLYALLESVAHVLTSDTF